MTRRGTPLPSTAEAPAGPDEHVDARLLDLQRRHEAFRAAVTDVLRAEDLDVAMARLVEAAAAEPGASTVVLALASLPGLVGLVFALGIAADDAAAIAATLPAPNPAKVPGVVVAVAVSPQR